MRIKIKPRCDQCQKQRSWVHAIDLPGLDELYYLCEYEKGCKEKAESFRNDPEINFVAPCDGEYVEVQVKRGSHF